MHFRHSTQRVRSPFLDNQKGAKTAKRLCLNAAPQINHVARQGSDCDYRQGGLDHRFGQRSLTRKRGIWHKPLPRPPSLARQAFVPRRHGQIHDRGRQGPHQLREESRVSIPSRSRHVIATLHGAPSGRGGCEVSIPSKSGHAIAPQESLGRNSFVPHRFNPV